MEEIHAASASPSAGVNPETVRDLRSVGRVIVWTDGERGRRLELRRPCACGCDGTAHGVGYLTGSDPQGRGFTLWIESETLGAIFGGQP